MLLLLARLGASLKSPARKIAGPAERAKGEGKMQEKIDAVVSFIRSLPPRSFADVADEKRWRLDYTTRPWDVVFVPGDAPQLETFTGGRAYGRTVNKVDRFLHSLGCRSGVIYINSSVSAVEQLHTLLHELGHLLCDPVTQWENGDTVEAAAEEFALAVLRRWNIAPALPGHDNGKYWFEHRGQEHGVRRATVKKAVAAALEKFFAAVTE